MRPAHRFPLMVLVLLVALSMLPAPPAAAVAPAAELPAPQAQADCDPERDLRGELVADGQGHVVNHSDTCSYPVGLAVYRILDGSLSTQELADWETLTIGPGQELDLAVDLPDCSSQVDLFYGPLIISFTEGRYGERRLDDHILAGNGRCRPTAPSCAAYAIGRRGDQQAHLLAIDPREASLLSLGALPRGMRGLALHPQSGLLYAAAGTGSDQSGTLMTIDRSTAAATPVGPSGFAALGALAFRGDGTLWGWAPGQGLLSIDPLSGAASLALGSAEAVTGMAWAADGSALFLAANRRVYRYLPGASGLELIGDGLPAGAPALAARPDGLLLLAVARSDGMALVSIDPQSRQVVATIAIRSDFDNALALAWPQGCGNPSAGGRATMIEEVTLDRTELCSGEEVLVEVRARHPESPGGPVDIAINGQWGASRYLRFSGPPGPRPIQVVAVTAEKFVDDRQLSVEIVECDPAPASLEVTLRPNPFAQHTVDFEVLNAAALAAPGASYRWEFGDGQSAQTSLPYAAHDYAAALQRDEAYTSFGAVVSLSRPGQPDLVAHKTVTVWSMYALAKQRGYLQPPVSAPDRLQISGGSSTLSISVHNPEDGPIAFTGRRLELQPCDAARDPLALPVAALQFDVAAGATSNHSFAVPAAALAADICGLAVTLEGMGPDGLPAFAGANVEVRANPGLTSPVSDPALLGLLNSVAGGGMVADPLHVSGADLYRLAREQRVQFPIPPAGDLGGPTTRGLERAPESAALAASPSAPGLAAADHLGEICVVGSPAPRPGLVCAPSGEWNWVPPRIANAYKGDAILSAGCGMIGDLLRQVAPPQRYSHSGLMVENYYSIRHSTASEDRYRDEDYAEGIFTHSDGIQADVLRYGWPGIITQSVDAAYNGEWLRDPINGKLYRISGFSADPVQCDGDLSLSYPLVVRPVPGADAAVRELLHRAADRAREMQGHYRFYAYTNAAISEDRSYDAPGSLSWDSIYPQLATVCSSFVWSALRAAGGVLEGATIEEADVRQGAERDGATVDGLYLYTQAERKAGAQWLYTNIYNEAAEEAGWFGNLLTGAADDIANQFTNCFGFDQCGEKDEQLWKNPGAGRAVSPDNLLFWDTPAQGGVYGYSEPIDFRPAEYVQLSRWAPAPDVGTIAGRVLYEGQPVAGAAVRLAGLELASGADGSFRDELVPAGSYQIVATTVRDGLTLETSAQVTISAGATTSIDLVLQPLPDYFREVVVQGSMFIVDDEIFDDETGTFTINETRLLNPTTRSADIRIQHCVGDEVRVELDIFLQLQNDNRSVSVAGEARMYERTSCDNDELEDRESFAYTLAPAASRSNNIFLENTEFAGGDTADIDFLILNGTQPRLIASAVTPEAGGELRSADGNLLLRFPAGAVTAPVSLRYASLPAPANPPPAGMLALRSFTLDAYGEDGAAVHQFEQPYTLTLHYDQAELSRQGVREDTLQLAFWDGAGWVGILPCAGCRVDQAANSVTVRLDHFTPFVLIGEGDYQVYLPLLQR